MIRNFCRSVNFYRYCFSFWRVLKTKFCWYTLVWEVLGIWTETIFWMLPLRSKKETFLLSVKFCRSVKFSYREKLKCPILYCFSFLIKWMSDLCCACFSCLPCTGSAHTGAGSQTDTTWDWWVLKLYTSSNLVYLLYQRLQWFLYIYTCISGADLGGA